MDKVSLSVVSCLLAIAVFGVTSSNVEFGSQSEAAVVSGSVPEVAVVGDDNKTYVVSSYTSLDTQHFSSENSLLNAMVTYLGDDRWKLDLHAKQHLQRIYFPFQTKRMPVASRVSDEIFYYPRLLGLAEKASARDTDWDWGLKFIYPGQLFAPLVVLASSSEARMVAATNWPPEKVKPLYAAERLALLYDEEVPINASVSYECMIVDVKGDSEHGDVPWQLALDRYRAWLDSHVPAPSYPDWMWEGQGFVDVQLEFHSPYDISSIRKLYQSHKDLYPWVLFWGQMNPPGSKICCALNQEMHAAYVDTLPDFVREVVAGGGHAGYYSTPYYGLDQQHPKRNLDTPEGRDWLLTWLGKNKNYGATGHYVDTVGWNYYGDPVQVMDLFKSGLIPEDSLIEGVTDIYPAASLVAGSLAGNGDGRDGFCGAPYRVPEAFDRTTFPRFGRYLFGDRLFYGGIANQDATFWGNLKYWKRGNPRFQVCGYVSYCENNGPCECGTERLAFLLGEKLDFRPPHGSEIVDAINQERIRADWWARRLVYKDTKGLDLTSIPPDSKVEVTRFEDRDGFSLFAISNPNLVAGLSFRFTGASIAIPVQKIAIVESGAAPPPSCAFSISRTTKSFDSNGGAGSVDVTAPASCNWTAASNNSWITISSGASGSGNGTVKYSVAANTVRAPRTGTLTVEGQSFTVTQGAMYTANFPQFANGARWVSSVVLTNPSRTDTASGWLSFFDSQGQAVSISVNRQTPANRIPFTIFPLGSSTFTTNGSGDLVTGSAQASAGIPISGVIKYFHPSLGTAGVPDGAPSRAVMAFVSRDAGDGLDSGIALSNPQAAPVDLALSLRGLDGREVSGGSSSLSIPANGHIAKFVHELFPGANTAKFQGSVIVTAASPDGLVSVAALRLGSYLGQFTTLPVVTADPAPTATDLYFAQFANGGGWRSSLYLANPLGETSTATLSFLDDGGNPLIVPADRWLTPGSAGITVQPQGSAVLSTDGEGALVAGTAILRASSAVGGVLTFTHPNLGTATVSGSVPAAAFIIPVVRSADLKTSTGVAIASAGTAVRLALTLRNESGEPVPGGNVTLDLPSNGHLARYVEELFPQVHLRAFRGTLTVAAQGGNIVGAALQLGEKQGELTALPVTAIR